MIWLNVCADLGCKLCILVCYRRFNTKSRTLYYYIQEVPHLYKPFIESVTQTDDAPSIPPPPITDSFPPVDFLRSLSQRQLE